MYTRYCTTCLKTKVNERSRKRTMWLIKFAKTTNYIHQEPKTVISLQS